jgi:hypothetical protein
MELKIVNDEVAFGGCCGWLLRGARHGDPNHRRERRAERTFEVLKHVSPLRSEIYHESGGEASSRALKHGLVLMQCCE